MSIQEYINAHRERFMEEWASLIRIPSVSCEASHKADMQRCAERWRELLLEAGCQKAQVISASNPSECPEAPSDGNPFVYAEFKCENEKIGKCENEKIGKCENEKIGKCENEKIPTVLVYAHYDVMPVEPLDAWLSDPWEPSVRNGRLYARGADDDKGQAMIQAKAFEYMAKTGQLRCNVKFIFEGEEEIGSPSLEAFLENHKDLLKADIILVSDTSMIGKDTPSITTGLRGLAYWQIEVDGPNRDLHSGHFGGAVKNPVNALCEM
ncbi:MAG: M20/M25/M40 family metallo-hydrolase, partial [Paludibacteraceae bacterium]|nr:M20/M25/M40 family metallo-hydrolase [Paludibacteraceae bacterium]